MSALTLLVLSNPADRHLAALERLPGETRIVVGDRLEAFANAAPEAEAILWWWCGRELLKQVLASAPRVRWVHAASAGVDGLLFPALVESPAALTNSRGVFSAPLGEFALAAMLYFAKDLRRMLRSQGEGRWDPFDVEMLAGRTVGLIGYGDIGRAVAERVRAMGMRVIAVRRRPELGSPGTDEVIPVERRGELMATADYVVVSAPLTPATRGLIGPAEIAAMKSSGVLINVGRGAVVDEQALIAALEQRRIRGAALDVFECEPLPEGHAFYRLENLLLSPHCADHTPGWIGESMNFFLENFERFHRGEPLENVVDKKAGY